MQRLLRIGLLTGFLAASARPALPQARETAAPATIPERTAFLETSRHADVMAALLAIAGGSEAVVLDTFGYSYEGRALPFAAWGSGPTRVLVLANIHAGEVEGKEAAQILLRELAAGRHAGWEDELTVLVAPIYNADGNERVTLTNRPLQSGPLGGMGQRANAQGLDLNRDFMKLEAPESRSLIGLMNERDPHLVIDLHATNGTPHGYHLTYSPPLHPDTDPGITHYLRDSLLPAVTAVLQARGWETWHYGNLPEDEGFDAPRGWYTFSPESRYGTNYIGLRNRFGILSEAFAYLPFEERIAVTHDFVTATLDFVAEHGGEIRARAREADGRSIAGSELAVATRFARTLNSAPILFAAIDTLSHPWTGEPMLRRIEPTRSVDMPAFISFEVTATRTAPEGYLVPGELVRVLELLGAHGIRSETLDRAESRTVHEFRISGSSQSAETFEGHRARTIEGAWGEAAERELPAGTVLVPLDQPLGRLVFHLLEPTATDGLVRWNILDEALQDEDLYPILRVGSSGH